MAINYPGPYEVRVFYEVVYPSATKQHVFRFSVELTTDPEPGATLTALEAMTLVGTPTNLLTWVDGLIAEVVEVYKTVSTINYAELWRYEEGTFNASWIGTWTIDEAGLSAAPAIEDSQLIFTFRTMAGGYGKLDLRGTINSPLVTKAYPSGDANWDAIATYAAGNGSIIVGRDGGHFVVPLNILSGSNEHRFKERLRP